MTTDALPPSETAARAEKRHPILQLLAQNVRGVRTAFGWSMKAAVTPGTIKNIETFRANPGLSILFRLSNGFGLTFSDLIDPTLLARLPKEPVSLVRYSDPEALSAAVGPKIVLSRRRRKLGRAKFAKISGVSKSMLLYVESGRMEPSLTTLVHIADGLNLPLAQLVEGNESPITATGARGHTLRALQINGAAEIIRDFDSGGIKLAMTELALRPRQRVAFPAGEAGARALIYVLEGYARLIRPAGEHNLDAEEAIIATADVGLTIANRGDTVARVLHLAAPPPDWTDRASETRKRPPMTKWLCRKTTKARMTRTSSSRQFQAARRRGAIDANGVHRAVPDGSTYRDATGQEAP